MPPLTMRSIQTNLRVMKKEKVWCVSWKNLCTVSNNRAVIGIGFCMTENDFTQNPADHCAYSREIKHGKVIMMIWVDDLIIAASQQ